MRYIVCVIFLWFGLSSCTTFDVSTVDVPAVEYKNPIFKDTRVYLQDNNRIKFSNTRILDNCLHVEKRDEIQQVTDIENYYFDVPTSFVLEIMLDEADNVNSQEKITLSGILRTKLGTEIKKYTGKGTSKIEENYTETESSFYSFIDRMPESIQRAVIVAYANAYGDIIRQINSDKSVESRALKIKRKEDAEIQDKAMHKIDSTTFGYPSYSGQYGTFDKNTIYSFTGHTQGRSKFGVYAGQNTYDGNLADHYYTPMHYGVNKIFVEGKHDYFDGEAITGLYLYKGNYQYTSVLGALKTVPRFAPAPKSYKKYLEQKVYELH